MAEPEFDDDSRRILVGSGLFGTEIWAQVSQASGPPASPLKFYEGRDCSHEASDFATVYTWHNAFSSLQSTGLILQSVRRHWMKRFHDTEVSKTVANERDKSIKAAIKFLSRPLHAIDAEPYTLLSKKPNISSENGHPEFHTANIDDNNNSAIMEKFWRGHELNAVENNVMRNTINSGQVKEPEKGEDKLDTELEITLSAVKTPSFPAQELFLSPTLRIRTSMLNMFREVQVQRERVHQLKDTLEKYRYLIGWLVKVLRKEQAIGLGLLHEMTGRPEVTIQEHRHPQSLLTLRDTIKKNGEQGFRELCYESQWSLYAPLEKLRVTASSISNQLHDVPALPIHEEIPCLDNIQDLQLSYCEWVDDIVKFDRNTNVQKDVFSLVKDTAELADRYRKEQAVISPIIAQDCTLQTREQKQSFIETKFKNVLPKVPTDDNRLEEAIKEARAIARITEAQRVLRVLDEFIKAAGSFDRIHLDQQMKEEPT